MIASQEVAKGIRSRFKTRVQDARPVETYYDNLPPEDIRQGLHVVVNILDGETIAWAGALADPVNSSCFRKVGLLQVDIYSPADTGTAEARELADFIAVAFAGASEAPGIQFFTPSDRPFGVEGEMYRHMVEIPWKAEG